MEFVKIIGNEVNFVSEKIMKTVGLEDFMANIEARLTVETGIMPRNCLCMKRSGDMVGYLIEVPTQLVNIKVYSGRGEEGNIKNLVISIPFTQFYVMANHTKNLIVKSYVTVTKMPIQGGTDSVFVAPYPNIHGSGMREICVGTMKIPQTVPLNQKINSVVSAFFEASFNHDLGVSVPSNFKLSESNRLAYLEEWAERTKEDRFFGISEKILYKDDGKTVTTWFNEVYDMNTNG
jgi:hypothetical protein